jgi:hypothetical protein
MVKYKLFTLILMMGSIKLFIPSLSFSTENTNINIKQSSDLEELFRSGVRYYIKAQQLEDKKEKLNSYIEAFKCFQNAANQNHIK